MKIYVGTYAKYNAGSIAGDWLTLDDYADRDDFLEACAKLHANESDPEFMFQDWEEIPDSLVSESSIDPRVWDYMLLDDDDRKIVAALVDMFGADISDAIENYSDAMVIPCDYEHQAPSAFLEFWLECNDVPAHVLPYVCEDRLWRNAQYDFTFVDGVGLVQYYG